MAGFIPDAQSQDWCTPQWILDGARAAFGVEQIDLDPCSNSVSVVNAKVSYRVPANDGLQDSWDFPSIFVNPPFGTTHMHRERRDFVLAKQWQEMTKEQRAEYVTTDVADWLERCALAFEHHGSQAIALVPVTPETVGWKSAVWPRAAGICFFGKRIKFIDAATGVEAKMVIPKPMAVIYWGKDFERFEEAFSKLGAVIPVGRTLARTAEDLDFLEGRVEDLETQIVTGLDAAVAAVDTSKASLVVLSGEDAANLPIEILTKLRERMRERKTIPENAAWCVFPDVEVHSYTREELLPIIEKLTKMLPANEPTTSFSLPVIQEG